MEKLELYKLNKDVLVKLVLEIQEELKRELEFKDLVISQSGISYRRCISPLCTKFCIEGRHNPEILTCNKWRKMQYYKKMVIITI